MHSRGVLNSNEIGTTKGTDNFLLSRTAITVSSGKMVSLVMPVRRIRPVNAILSAWPNRLIGSIGLLSRQMFDRYPGQTDSCSFAVMCNFHQSTISFWNVVYLETIGVQ